MKTAILAMLSLLTLNYTYAASISQGTTKTTEPYLKIETTNYGKVIIRLEANPDRPTQSSIPNDKTDKRSDIPTYFDGDSIIKRIFIETFSASEIDTLIRCQRIILIGGVRNDGRFWPAGLMIPEDSPILSFDKHKITQFLRRCETELFFDTSEWKVKYSIGLHLPLNLNQLKTDKPLFRTGRTKVF